MTLFSFRKAGERLGIDRARLSRWAKSGLIKTVKLEAQVKVPLHEIERIEREGVSDPVIEFPAQPPRPKKSPGDAVRKIPI